MPAWQPAWPIARTFAAPRADEELVLLDAFDPTFKEVRLADEGSDEAICWPVVEIARTAELLDPPVVHDRNPVGHHERLALVMGHIDKGDAEALVQALDLELQPFAQLLVQGAQWLIHQEHARVEDDGAR